jgi:cytochrome c553
MKNGLVTAAAAVCAAWIMAPMTAAAAGPAELFASSCAGCHGAQGNTPAGTIPKIAGQQPVYIVKQLTEAASGKRKSPEMQACVDASKGADLEALAGYLRSLPMAPGSVSDAALAEIGKGYFHNGIPEKGVSACVSCHEEGGLGSDKHPRLRSQHKDYILKQIGHFQAGERTNDKGRQMRNVAEKLSPEEKAAAAAYLSSLE